MKIELVEKIPFKNEENGDHANGATDDEKVLTISKDIIISSSLSTQKEEHTNGFNLENGVNELSYKGKNKRLFIRSVNKVFRISL